MAQFLFTMCFLLFMIKSVLASPLSTSASAFNDLSTLSELIDTSLNNPSSKFTPLISRGDVQQPAEHTHLMTAPGLEDIADPPVNGTTAEYVRGSGMCSLHLWEAEACGRHYKTKRYAALELRNSGGDIIVHPERGANDGKGINIDQPWEVKSQLPYVLVIDGNGKDNNVQFRYMRYGWMSNTKRGGPQDPYCNQGGWDPRERYWYCSIDKYIVRRKQMDCFFPC
ncbi:hypothetical protein AJ78_03081 [Emergomyces pasteurianus Ep9510]|uniref:Uncharacterized protein n=1 Tax=Emergomyces pasteurianus Ep9510 TaxID=1447872 RepID=A0A1J9QKS7_9EURO|nr:hypothetical protein AJ78_03081 [Emergomyces pasteurianus Ep9510]